MKKITKKDFKKLVRKNKVSKKDVLDELIDDSGALIDGDENNGTDIVTTGWNNPQTSREFSRKTSQGPRYYYSPNYGHQYYRESVEDDDNLIGENKMRSMIEDIMRKSSYDDMDFVSRYDDYDMSKESSIPLFSQLKTKHNKPLLARKTLFLGDLMKKEMVNGEELAIILNHLLSNNSDIQIPKEYKKELISRINGEFKTEK
jgi:hypothetical protein